MTVSIVLTAYKRPYALAPTLDTLINQTFEDFELLIMDDSPDTATEEVALAYVDRDKRISYIRNRQRLGMPGNLNAGIKLTSRPFVANLHDGDLYDPTLLEKWVQALEACPSAAFVFNGYRALDEDSASNEIFREEGLAPCGSGIKLIQEMFGRWSFSSPVWGTVMARRSAYEIVNFFDPRFGLWSDVDMWLRLAEEHSVAYVDEPLIMIPSRKSVPSHAVGLEPEQQRTLEKMFWEARLRHNRGKPLALASEVGRHVAFVLASRGYRRALRIRRKLLTLMGRLP